ncbi:MAG: hypothetical protein J2P44_10350 [Candidatus Dormibacteraeota bacterium]|nr:hypothetical protein [Candidatus Dormibacteraeota bacterium]
MPGPVPDRQTFTLRLGLVLALALLAAACGTPGARPSPTPAVSPTPTPTPQPLLAVVDQGSPLNTLLLINLSGQPVAQTLISKNAVIAGTTATEVAYENNGQLQALRSDGEVVTLGSMTGFKGGRVVLSPDGKQWMWSTYNRQSGDQVHSFVYLNNRLVADDLLQGRFFEPVAWTKKGVVFEEAEMGLTGYQPFDLVTGRTLLLQPDKQSAGNPPQGPQLTSESCFYGDLSDDGTLACRTPSGSVVTSTDSVQVTPTSGAPFNVNLPMGQFTQAGAISILPSALQTSSSAPGQAVVGGATLAGATSGGQGEAYSTAIVNLATHAVTPLPTGGLRPGAGSWTWLSPTQLITYRPSGATGGAPGIYIANTSGGVSALWPQGTPVGLLDQGGSSSNSPQPSPSGTPSPGGII